MRCKKEVCKFIRDNLNIKIYSSSDSPNAIVREVLNDEEIKQIMYDNNIVKLFYQNSKELRTWEIVNGLHIKMYV